MSIVADANREDGWLVWRWLLDSGVEVELRFRLKLKLKCGVVGAARE